MARRRSKDTGETVTYAGEEDLRFIRNFHDVFLSIGLALLLFGLYLATEIMVVLPNLLASASPLQAVSGHFLFRALVFGALAVLSWGLAEIFARTRRLTLPSIVLFSAWSWFIFFAAAVAYLGVKVDVQSLDQIMDALKSFNGFPLYMSIVMSAASLAFYIRMKLPFAMGALGASLASFVFSLHIYNQGWSFGESAAAASATFNSLWILSGGVLFALGVYFDALDPERRTRFSDNGFWLHLFAAPILFTGIMSRFGDGFSPQLTLGIIGLFALVSLLINRRALLVSGLLTAAWAISQIASELDGLWSTATTLIALGGAMVLLGGAWHGLRALIVAPFPKTGPIARIIPPVVKLA